MCIYGHKEHLELISGDLADGLRLLVHSISVYLNELTVNPVTSVK